MIKIEKNKIDSLAVVFSDNCRFSASYDSFTRRYERLEPPFCYSPSKESMCVERDSSKSAYQSWHPGTAVGQVGGVVFPATQEAQ
jgi:hypothetical protein